MSVSKAEKLSVSDTGKLLETRFFTENDRGALREIYLESRKNALHWLADSLFNLNDFDRDTDGECIWVATVNGEPVGFISVWEPDNFLHNLFVYPSSTGRGIGSALLKVCLNKIDRPAKLKCLEKNINAKNFYLSKGWETVSYGDGPDGQYQLMEFDTK
ncbi:MAG: GNAT family N-acetyltransferase [Gammaproteobacteria bacterium]|nr:GNAT family N-acetyltransferase [Gammaproteobacteria bacterium]